MIDQIAGAPGPSLSGTWDSMILSLPLGRTDADRFLHVTFAERGGGTLIRPISRAT
jgi:hypothetical protein